MEDYTDIPMPDDAVSSAGTDVPMVVGELSPTPTVVSNGGEWDDPRDDIIYTPPSIDHSDQSYLITAYYFTPPRELFSSIPRGTDSELLSLDTLNLQTEIDNFTDEEIAYHITDPEQTVRNAAAYFEEVIRAETLDM